MGNDKMGGKAQFSYSCAPLLTQVLIKPLCLSHPIAQSMLDWLEETQKITSIHSLICPVNIYRHNPLTPTHFTLLHIMSTMHNMLLFPKTMQPPATVSTRYKEFKYSSFKLHLSKDYEGKKHNTMEFHCNLSPAKLLTNDGLLYTFSSSVSN